MFIAHQNWYIGEQVIKVTDHSINRGLTPELGELMV